VNTLDRISLTAMRAALVGAEEYITGIRRDLLRVRDAEKPFAPHEVAANAAKHLAHKLSLCAREVSELTDMIDELPDPEQDLPPTHTSP
jgi:hypothetical protein